jgi:hypothetical protein
MLSNTKNLAGSQIRVDEDFSLKTRNTRHWIPFLKDANKNGFRAFLKKDKLVVNGPGLCGEEYSTRSRRQWFGHPCGEQRGTIGGN